jgi:DNA polymerase-3 subunit alpha
LDGATRLTDEKGNPSEFIKSMAAAKFPALAITDHGNLYGAIEFYSMCTDVGIKPIIGMESYIAPESRLDRKAAHRKPRTTSPFWPSTRWGIGI